MEWTPDAEFVRAMMGLSGWLSRNNRVNRGMAGPNRFTDENAARQEGFTSLIVPGNLGMMAMATSVQRWLPDARISKLDCVFRQPLNQGETVTATGVVTDRHDGEEEITLEMDLYLTRQDGQRPQGGTAIVVLPKQS
jgi:acyl dehydratase